MTTFITRLFTPAPSNVAGKQDLGAYLRNPQDLLHSRIKPDPNHCRMKLAMNQPYFFPYLGFYQMIHAVDQFVIYDTFNYIKSGWVHRNRLLVVGRRPAHFTIPSLPPISSKHIRNINL